MPNTNHTKTKDCPTRTPPKQKIAQHEPTKTKDCPTRTPPKQKVAQQHEPHQNKTTIKENKRLPNTNPTKTKQQSKKIKHCPTRTPPKQNNNQRKQRIAQHEPHQNKTTIKENKRLPNTNPTKTKHY